MDAAIKHLNPGVLQSAANVILGAKTVLVAGNGGSAAIANHLTCDMSKGTYPTEHIRVISLSCNTPLITAIANDLGYDQTFVHQAKLISPEYCSDVLILISSSGNSPNIIAAARWAKEADIKIIGFTGFEGGELKKLADISIHIPSNNYGIVEDCHSIAMHAIAQYIGYKHT